MAIKSLEPHWEEDFHIDLEGARGMRILLYEEDAKQNAVLRGKAEIEVSVFPISLQKNKHESILMLLFPALW